MVAVASEQTLPPLAEPEDLAEVLGVPADNVRLVAAIRKASSRFRGQVRWPVSEVKDVTVTLDGNGRRSLRLPVREVTACAVILRGAGGASGTPLVDGVDFEWSTDGILDRLGGLWPDRRRAVIVTYTAGFEIVPDDIQEAVLDQAEAMFNGRRGLSSKQVGGITESYGSVEAVGVSEQWARAVAAYQIKAGDRS